MNGSPTNSVSPTSTVAAGDVDQFLSVNKVTPAYQGSNIASIAPGVVGWIQPSNIYLANWFYDFADTTTTSIVARIPVSLSYLPAPYSNLPSVPMESASDMTVYVTQAKVVGSTVVPDFANVLGQVTVPAEMVEAAASATWPEPQEMLLSNWTTVSTTPLDIISGTDNVVTTADSWAVAGGGTNSDGNYNPEVWIANYLNGTLQPWKQGTNLPGMTSSSTTTTYTPESLPYSSRGNVLALAGSAVGGLTGGTGNRYCSYKSYTASLGQDGTMGAWVRQADIPNGSTTVTTSTTVSTTTTGTLNLSDTTGFPQSGYVNITHAGLLYTGSYSGISGNTLTGVQLIWNTSLSLTTSNGDKVVSGFMDCYSQFVSLTDANDTTNDWLLVFGNDNSTVYAGSLDDGGKISSWVTVTCSSPFVQGQPYLLSDGTTLCIASDNAKSVVLATISLDASGNPTFSDWTRATTWYTNVSGLNTMGIFNDTFYASSKTTKYVYGLAIDSAKKNFSQNPVMYDFTLTNTDGTATLPAPIKSGVWCFSNFDGSYDLFSLVISSSNSTQSLLINATAYQSNWINVPVPLINVGLGTAVFWYFVVIDMPTTNPVKGVNFPVVDAASSAYPTLTSTTTSTTTWPSLTVKSPSGATNNAYIPIQILAKNQAPNGSTGRLLALASDANGTSDTKVTYFYIGSMDGVLYAAGEWTNNERGFFTLTYDDNNALIEITEVS